MVHRRRTERVSDFTVHGSTGMVLRTRDYDHCAGQPKQAKQLKLDRLDLSSVRPNNSGRVSL